MSPHPEQLWRRRAGNWLQTLLLVGGLACVMALPGWALLGGTGVLWALSIVAIAMLAGGRIPARVLLAHAGAGLLHRRHAPRLHAVVDALYRRAGMSSPPALYYLPSPELNAFAVGDAQDGGIVVSDGLLRCLDLRQAAGVLAHEVSHLRNGDTRVMTLAAIMTELTFWGATAAQLFIIFLVPAIIAGDVELPWLTLLVVALAPTVSSLLQLALSRNREYAADLEAVALTGDAAGLASALRILETYHGGWLYSRFGRRQPRWLHWLRTHPPTDDRVRRLLALGEHEADSFHRLLQKPRPSRLLVRQAPTPLGSRYWITRRF